MNFSRSYSKVYQEQLQEAEAFDVCLNEIYMYTAYALSDNIINCVKALMEEQVKAIEVEHCYSDSASEYINRYKIQPQHTLWQVHWKWQATAAAVTVTAQQYTVCGP